MSDNKNVSQKVFDNYFRKHRKIALVFTRSSKGKVEDYDPFRDTGYAITNQNPLPVKVLGKSISPNSWTIKELGKVANGAIFIILNNRDVTLVQNSEKIMLDGREYYVQNDNAGSNFQIWETDHSDFSKIILFRKQIKGTK